MYTSSSEHNSCVLIVRFAVSMVYSLVIAGDPFENIRLIGDSKCTLASIEKVYKWNDIIHWGSMENGGLYPKKETLLQLGHVWIHV